MMSHANLRQHGLNQQVMVTVVGVQVSAGIVTDPFPSKAGALGAASNPRRGEETGPVQRRG